MFYKPIEFFLAEMIANYTKVAEEYCRPIMWRQGGQAVVDQVPVCWSFHFNWTPLYKHI
jgi:hypothetical protein